MALLCLFNCQCYRRVDMQHKANIKDTRREEFYGSEGSDLMGYINTQLLMKLSLQKFQRSVVKTRSNDMRGRHDIIYNIVK